MSCKTAFLAIVLDDASRTTLDECAASICKSAADLLGVAGVEFRPTDTDKLHMTFVFCAEHLIRLTKSKLIELHGKIQEEVTNSRGVKFGALMFRGFDLFPPDKMNLIVAHFEPPKSLMELRATIWRLCLGYGVALRDDQAWIPHVTLGKIQATKSQASKISCRRLAPLTQAFPLVPLGLTLLGVRPQQAWLDWDHAFTFLDELEHGNNMGAAVNGADGHIATPPALKRDVSREFDSKGASKYDEATLREWASHRDKAMAAVKLRAWIDAAAYLRSCVTMRPDWTRGHLVLHAAMTRFSSPSESADVLLNGFSNCLMGMRERFERGLDAQSFVECALELGEKLRNLRSGDICRVLGFRSLDTDGRGLCLYHNLGDAPNEGDPEVMLVDVVPSSLRLLFLDVDGVLNTSHESNCLIPELVARIRRVLIETRASVVLSTSWCSNDALRAIIVAALPPGSVVGQIDRSFDQNRRPAEIAAFLELPVVRKKTLSWAVVADMDLLLVARSWSEANDGLRHMFPQFERNFVRTNVTVGLDADGEARLVELLGEA